MTVDQFAKAQGYDGAKPCGKWHGYNAYKPYFDEGELTVGYPYLILERNGKLRMQTFEECYKSIFGKDPEYEGGGDGTR